MVHQCPLSRVSSIPSSTSAFIVTIVSTPDLYTGPLILLVHNRKEVRPDGSEKPAGFGMPGGKLKLDNDESPENAAKREFPQETGLSGDLIVSLSESEPEHCLLIPRPGGGADYVHCKYLEPTDGGFLWEYWDRDLRRKQRRLIPLQPGLRQTLVHTFVAEVDWSGSILASLFSIQAMFAGEDVEKGLALNVDPEMAKELGIVEAEDRGQGQEIDRLMVLPLDSISQGVRIAGVYPSHLKRIAQAIQMVEVSVR